MNTSAIAHAGSAGPQTNETASPARLPPMLPRWRVLNDDQSRLAALRPCRFRRTAQLPRRRPVTNLFRPVQTIRLHRSLHGRNRQGGGQHEARARRRDDLKVAAEPRDALAQPDKAE